MNLEDKIFKNFIKTYQATPTAQMEANYAKKAVKPTAMKENPLQPRLKSNDFKIK
jgi:hypothetical protein